MAPEGVNRSRAASRRDRCLESAGVQREAAPRACCSAPAPRTSTRACWRALAQPLVGHLDPAFLTVLDEVQARLRASSAPATG